MDSKQTEVEKLQEALDDARQAFEDREKEYLEELEAKSDMVQRLLLQIQQLKGDKVDGSDVKAFYEQELQQRDKQLGFARKLVHEFQKLYESAKERLEKTQKQSTMLSQVNEKQDRLIKKLTSCVKVKDHQLKQLETRCKQLKKLNSRQ